MVFQYFGISVLWVCLSGLVPFPSVVFELLQSSPESGDGLPQLVDFLLLPGYLRLDAGRLLGGEVFERQTFGDVATMFMIQGRTPRNETGSRADLRQGRCTCRYRKRWLRPLTRTGTNGMTPDTTCVRSGIRRGSV